MRSTLPDPKPIPLGQPKWVVLIKIFKNGGFGISLVLWGYGD
jgi:hypothetical protein